MGQPSHTPEIIPEQSPVAPKTEVATTAEALTAVEREPVEAAVNGHLPVGIAVQPISTSPDPDNTPTPMNLSPRDNSVLGTSFSHHLRETHLSDLSDLVQRFSTPELLEPSPAKSGSSEHVSEEGKPSDNEKDRTMTGGAASEQGESNDNDERAGVDIDATPVPSDDESKHHSPVEERSAQSSSAQPQHLANKNLEPSQSGLSLQNGHRPLSRCSASTISDSSDDNLSMSEERTIRLLKRRITKRVKVGSN